MEKKTKISVQSGPVLVFFGTGPVLLSRKVFFCPWRTTQNGPFLVFFLLFWYSFAEITPAGTSNDRQGSRLDWTGLDLKKFSHTRTRRTDQTPKWHLVLISAISSFLCLWSLFVLPFVCSLFFEVSIVFVRLLLLFLVLCVCGCRCCSSIYRISMILVVKSFDFISIPRGLLYLLCSFICAIWVKFG